MDGRDRKTCQLAASGYGCKEGIKNPAKNQCKSFCTPPLDPPLCYVMKLDFTVIKGRASSSFRLSHTNHNVVYHFMKNFSNNGKLFIRWPGGSVFNYHLCWLQMATANNDLILGLYI